MSKHEIIDVLNEDGAIVDTISREQAELDNHITENVLEDLEWISSGSRGISRSVL